MVMERFEFDFSSPEANPRDGSLCSHGASWMRYSRKMKKTLRSKKTLRAKIPILRLSCEGGTKNLSWKSTKHGLEERCLKLKLTLKYYKEMNLQYPQLTIVLCA